jgi:uncharacterized protein (DUF2252 family)
VIPVGKAVRRAVPRSRHGEWEPPSRDPLPILAEQDRSRLPELVPIRYERMLTSPFAFFRGAAAVMATDLAETPSTGLEVQLCGDAHLANFGVFAAPDRRLVFDCNDFDETCRGPFEWDLKRLAASVAIAGRHRGFDRRQRQRSVGAAVSAYREAMRRFAAMRNIDVWYARIDVEARLAEFRQRLDERRLRRIEKGLSKARSKDSLRALRKLTHEVEGETRIVSDQPLITPLEELADGAEAKAQLLEVLDAYRASLSDDRRRLAASYRYVHAARKVVGVGSVGTRAYLVLCFGSGDYDPLFLQVKEAIKPVHAAYLPPFMFREQHEGRRVVGAQRLLQSLGDPLLGYTKIDGRDYFVRQMKNMKASMPVPFMIGEPFNFWAFVCGALLARSHARTGDAVRIAGYCGDGDTLDRALVEFAESYGDQTERDHGELVKAISSGRVKAVMATGD